MSLSNFENPITAQQTLGVSDRYDPDKSLHLPTHEGIVRFGEYQLKNAQILETPAGVLQAGEVLTNPSQIEMTHVSVNGHDEIVPFAYFRKEPTTMHLGKTTAVPYIIRKQADGGYHLDEYINAMELPGEDPRLTPNVAVRGALGNIYRGWAVSTVVATPEADNPEAVKCIKQTIYFGETLANMQPVAEIEGLKNTCIFPVSGSGDSTELHVFGRPHPDITYARVNDISEITKELVEAGTNLTQGYMPANVHTGVNNVKSVPGHPNLLELDIHLAQAPRTADNKKILDYSLARAGLEFTESGLLMPRLIPLGQYADRSHFPGADPKPPENDVADYMNILYGSLGRYGLMVTGVSDRHVGVAEIVRVG